MDNYNYPPGADTPDAPWNQPDLEEQDVDICVSTTLSKSLTVTTTDYRAEKWEDYDVDEDGYTIHTGGIDYDFSECDLNKEYSSEEYTIPELLEKLEEIADAKIKKIKKDLEVYGNMRSVKYNLFKDLQEWTKIKESASGWIEDELEVVQE